MPYIFQQLTCTSERNGERNICSNISKVSKFYEHDCSWGCFIFGLWKILNKVLGNLDTGYYCFIHVIIYFSYIFPAFNILTICRRHYHVIVTVILAGFRWQTDILATGFSNGVNKRLNCFEYFFCIAQEIKWPASSPAWLIRKSPARKVSGNNCRHLTAYLFSWYFHQNF